MVAERRGEPESDLDDLRARGARLLERSRDVWSDEDTHPAFSRILDGESEAGNDSHAQPFEIVGRGMNGSAT